MNEERETTAELSNSGDKQVEQISSLYDKSAKELETVLATLAALPFKDEMQQSSFLEHVQRLQGYHIIQLFNLGIVPLQRSLVDSSAVFIEEVIKLVEMCFSFCYTTDVPRRVAFDYYARALKFCFPLEPRQCLSTAVVSKLLELVQIFQEGKLADTANDETKNQATFTNFQLNGTNYFFGKLLHIFESRRHGEHLEEIIEETLRIASVDASHATTDLALQSFEHVVSPVFVRNWIKLLMSTDVSCGFAVHLAKVDSLSSTEHSTICYFVTFFEEMKRNGIKVSLPCDKERLGIFFNHLNHFCTHPNMTAISLKLLASTGISNEVLTDVLDQFFYKEEVATDFREIAFKLVFTVLSLLPGGELVKKVLQFWKEAFSADPEYQALACLLALFLEEPNNKTFRLHEAAEKIFDFVEGLPRPLFPWISLWQRFLWWFLKIFPTTFQKRPEMLVFINKVVALAAREPVEQPGKAYVITEHVRPTFQFLQWLCQQNGTEEVKSEMIQLLFCYTGDESLNWVLATDTFAIKALCSCPWFPFSTKEHIARELNYLSSFFRRREKDVVNSFIEKVASNQTLEFTEELLFEFLDFIKRFVDDQSSSTIPEDILTILSFLSRLSISGKRSLKVLNLAMKRGGSVSSLHILELIELHRGVLQERTNEYFDLLFDAIVETLKGDDLLCEQLCNQHRGYFPSTGVLKVWTSSVAELISSSLFREEIDSRCCYRVLQHVWGFSSESEISQLLTLVRATAIRVVQPSSHGQVDASSSCNVQHTSLDHFTDLLQNFVTSVTIILGTDVLSTSDKMLLVTKVCEVVVSTPHVLRATLESALINLIPWIQYTSSNNEGTPLEVNRIVAVLDNPEVMNQLSRIPVGNSLCSGLSTKMFSPFSRVDLVDVFLFIGSLQDVNQEFFNHLIPFVEVAIQRCMTVKDVLEILKELVQVLRNIRSELIPLTMFNFAYFTQNPVNKQDRDEFLSEVAMRWELSPNHRLLSFLEVPRLLWNAYNTASSSAKRSEMIDRVQEILKKSNQVGVWAMGDVVFSIDLFTIPRDHIRRRIACCELEWLVLHSSLPTEDAALACDLSCRFFQPFHQDLRCLTFFDVQIKDGIFTFVPHTRKTASRIADNCTESTSLIARTSKKNLATQLKKRILTPALIAKEVIYHLKRVLEQNEDPSEIAFQLWDLLFSPREQLSCESECTCVSHWSVIDDYVDVLLSILAEASSLEMMFLWARLDRHHVCQCSDVILKACKWNNGNENDVNNQALWNLQTVVSTTLEKMRLNYSQRTSGFLPWCSTASSYAVPCFRLLEAELKQLGNMLESKLPIEVTTRVLELYQINVQAGVTVGEIVSSWSCKQQSLELVENIQRFCEGDEISSLKPAQIEFALQLLKVFGRFCTNSYEDLIAKFQELIELYDPEYVYVRGLNRLPKWRETMIADGFPILAVDSWCAAFLMTPHEDLTARDVDAIVDLNSSSLRLVVSVSQVIKQVIFPEDGFKVTQGEGINESSIKEGIRLARLLGEFINILKVRKPEENHNDAFVRDIVVDACFELCKSLENKNRRNDLYKIRDKKLKALFTELFDKRRKSEDVKVGSQDVEMTQQAESEGRQSSYLHDKLPPVLTHKHVYESMLVLLRRWLSGVIAKPSLASHTLEIAQLFFSLNPSDVGPGLLQELNGIIQTRILSLEENRSLMAQLQAAGYNQRSEGIPDLWSSCAVELPCYLTKRESPNRRLFTKKLSQVLRLLWNEWKNILFTAGIVSVNIGDAKVHTEELFSNKVSLDEMEKQAAAVKEAVKQVNSGDLDVRVTDLIRREQQHRTRIEKRYKSNKVCKSWWLNYLQ